MDNLRWILIFAGVAILALLYFTGRSRQQRREAHRETARQGDPLMGDEGYLGDHANFDATSDHYGFDERFDPDDMARPGEDLSATGAYDYPDELEEARPRSGFAGLSEKIEAFSAKLRPTRKQRVAESVPADENDQSNYASKIVTLHVVAPQDQLIPGDQLLAVLQEREYFFGDMNVFHSMHNGETVFVIAKVVEPGYFDMNDVESFNTPGISLILQLPGPVPADVAFEVLVSEAFEIADKLGAMVLDGDRSSLSNQTVQHMREGIYEYMHRQKYFGNVAS
ncbi:MAG: hypothetical protein CSB44_02520 [Gammaproteobacteria bacterium]|nr:MAG: hypothetical protein CSB44_02520 [Gammaproteobacteria bacterium]